MDDDVSTQAYDPMRKSLFTVTNQHFRLIELSLVGGRQGLERSVPQAEGIAMDEQGVIYMISDPDLFYTFEKRPADRSPGLC